MNRPSKLQFDYNDKCFNQPDYKDMQRIWLMEAHTIILLVSFM